MCKYIPAGMRTGQMFHTKPEQMIRGTGWKKEHVSAKQDRELKEVDMNFIKKQIKKQKKIKSLTEEFFIEERIDFFEITYEDMFSPDVSIKEKKNKVRDIIRFSGQDGRSSNETDKKVENILTRSKYTSNEYIRSFSNFDELKKLSGKENGFLL